MMKRLPYWRDMAGQAGSYAWIGGVGFVVEALVLTALVSNLALNIFISRTISFTVAMVVTWYLNHHLTFSDRSRGNSSKTREYGRYVMVQVIGATFNLAVFSAIVAYAPILRTIPVIPLAIGALFGLLINFTGARLWVFKA